VVPTVFWGKLTCQGWEDFSFRNLLSALNLMGDWCGPTFRHRLIENRGALPKDHELGEKKKKEKEQSSFYRRGLCLLTCLLMGDPVQVTE